MCSLSFLLFVAVKTAFLADWKGGNPVVRPGMGVFANSRQRAENVAYLLIKNYYYDPSSDKWQADNRLLLTIPLGAKRMSSKSDYKRFPPASVMTLLPQSWVQIQQKSV